MALTNKLSAIGDAIRAKTGKSDLLTLDAMPTEIAAIETGGGGLPDEALVITGDCRQRFAYSGWNWFLNEYGSRLTTKDITNCSSMFDYNSTIISIPFELNLQGTSVTTLENLFRDCYSLKNISRINNIRLGNRCFYGMFQNCRVIRELPDNIGEWFDWDKANAACLLGGVIFRGCYSLRKIPDNFFGYDKNNSTSLSSSYLYWYNCFSYCYALDELYLPIPECYTTGILTSNSFYTSFDFCNRLKSLRFATDENGAPYAVNWKTQTIDLSKNVGYANNTSNCCGYNSGIAIDKVITSQTYNALKDDIDAYTLDINYSLYNHDSAVETINSLPDASAYLATAGGTNTIKFKGAAGYYTDGGAINTLTPEEIAVATAKGWTVTFA